MMCRNRRKVVFFGGPIDGHSMPAEDVFASEQVTGSQRNICIGDRSNVSGLSRSVQERSTVVISAEVAYAITVDVRQTDTSVLYRTAVSKFAGRRPFKHRLVIGNKLATELRADRQPSCQIHGLGSGRGNESWLKGLVSPSTTEDLDTVCCPTNSPIN